MFPSYRHLQHCEPSRTRRPMKTFTATPKDIRHDWYVVDAAGGPLGRLPPRGERVGERAGCGMLPKNSLSRQVLRHKLRVYAGAEHPHIAQQPAPLAVYAP